MEGNEITAQLPSSFYYIVGVIAIANIGTMIGLFVVSLKGAFWLGSTLKEITKKADEAKASAVRAHKRIDTIKDGE